MRAEQFVKHPVRNNIFLSKSIQIKILRGLWCNKALHTTEIPIKNLPRKLIRHFQGIARPNALPLIIVSLLMSFVCLEPTFSVAVEDLKAPVKDLKDTIFGGWMWIPKIGAAVGGCLLAVYNQTIMPLATGAGIGLGIHFYDLYINADGALI